MPEKTIKETKQMSDDEELLVCRVTPQVARCIPIDEISEFLKTRKSSQSFTD